MVSRYRYWQYVLSFHIARVWQTDGQTDGQNYDPQDRASIAASRCKNVIHVIQRKRCTVDISIWTNNLVVSMSFIVWLCVWGCSLIEATVGILILYNAAVSEKIAPRVRGADIPGVVRGVDSKSRERASSYDSGRRSIFAGSSPTTSSSSLPWITCFSFIFLCLVLLRND